MNQRLLIIALLGSIGLRPCARAASVSQNTSLRAQKKCEMLLAVEQINSSSLTAVESVQSNLTEDLTFPPRLSQIANELRASGNLESQVEIDPRMQSFREAILPLFKIGIHEREATVRAMEADLRMHSFFTRSSLVAAAQKGKPQLYDLVIIGAGIHGIIAGLAALKENPDLRLLFVESTDTAASNFRYIGETAALNSSNRASAKDRLPLPGGGNLNEIPLAPIQIADFSAEKYPSFGDLGATMVAALYSLQNRYPNVDVAFNTHVETLAPQGKNDRLTFSLRDEGGETIEASLDAQATIVATGLGRPKFPKDIVEMKDFKKLRSSGTDADGNPILAKISTVSEVLQLAYRSENPASLFADKELAIVGKGDSARTLIEFFLGFGPNDGYGLSAAQDGITKNICWIGAGRSCDDYAGSNRSRYLRLAGAFPKFKPIPFLAKPRLSANLLQGIPKKLFYIQPQVDGSLFLIVSKSPGVTDNFSADNVILATGYESSIRDLLNNNYDNPKKLSREELFQRYGDISRDWMLPFDFLTGVTTTSGDKQTLVARIIRSNAERVQIAIVGPPAGRLPSDRELVGVFENTVSIFNHAPRTRSAAAIMARKISATRIRERGRPPLKFSERRESFRLEFQQSSRSLGRSDEAQLVATVQAAFKLFDLKALISSRPLKISFWKDRPASLQVETDGFQSEDLMKALGAAGNFIPIVAKITNGLEPNTALTFSITIPDERLGDPIRVTLELDSAKPVQIRKRKVIANIESIAQ